MKRSLMAAFVGILVIFCIGIGVSLVWAQDPDPCSDFGSISGVKFADSNGNGVQDPGESGLSGWTIEIWDENGPLGSAVTDDNGAYSFTCVNPGQFYVREVPVDGWVQTTPVEECFLPGADGEALSLGPCYTIDMAPEGVLTDVNFGNFHEVAVALDIKPQSCRNPVRYKTTGTLPVAILGTENFNVEDIDMSTVEVAGVSPLRWRMEDVAAPFYPLIGRRDAFDCTTDGADGFKDVVMHFSMKEIRAALQSVHHGEVRTIHLSGELLDGSLMLGEDVIVILNPSD